MRAAWTPQAGPQADAISATWCEELFFGGAKYGGKSDLLLGDYLQDVEKYGKNWQGILFRQSMPEFEELIRRSHELYLPTGATWLDQKRTWKWPNGAALKLRYMEHERDFYAYNGHSYTWEGFDELGQWKELTGYKMMIGCLRWGEADIPTKRIRASGNPGGPGHAGVKERFIDIAPGGYKAIYDPDTKMHRMFIPSRIQSNKLGLLRDPNYISRLNAVGSPQLVRAWLEGDWNVVSGAYFPELGAKHMFQAFEIPESWLKFRSVDWGSARPFSVQWWAVSDGEFKYCDDEREFVIPRGALIQYREWYGCESANKGLKLHAPAVAQGIVNRTPKDERIAYTVCDPSMFAEDGGPSIAETFAKNGVQCIRGDNKRMPGWEEMRARIVGEDGKPFLYVFDTCTHWWRTAPIQQHDQVKTEELDSDGEDHAVDSTRYACASRPWVRVEKKRNARMRPTLNELLAIEPEKGTANRY